MFSGVIYKCTLFYRVGYVPRQSDAKYVGLQTQEKYSVKMQKIISKQLCQTELSNTNVRFDDLIHLYLYDPL